MKKLLGISLIAMMSVTAANADIASKAYVVGLNSAMDTRMTAAEGSITTLNAGSSTAGSVDSKIAAAVDGLDGTTVTAGDDEYISQVSEENGIVSAAKRNVGSTVMSGYEIATTNANVANTDTLNQALGKLQKQVDDVETNTGGSLQSDGFYISQSNNVAQNLGALDTGLGQRVSGSYISNEASVNANLSALDTKIGASPDANGTYTAITSGGTVNANIAALDAEIAAMDYTASNNTGKVVTNLGQTDGVLTTVTWGDPLTNAAYSLQGVGKGAGKYVLTAMVNGNNEVTGYTWELIERGTANPETADSNPGAFVAAQPGE